jgi:Tfp pilus assembly protein PilO
MRRSFSVPAGFDWRRLLPRGSAGRIPAVRIAIGTLVAANLAAAWFVFNPPGGSLEDLESQIVATRLQIMARQSSIARLHRSIDKTDQARLAGDAFLSQYFLPRRHAYSRLEVELSEAATAAGIKDKGRSYSYEQVEGSDTLGMLTITANYEGTYADLILFLNRIDRAKRLLILESLQAQPLQGTPLLAMNMKLNAFFRFDGPQNDRAEKGEEGQAAVRNSDPESGTALPVKEVQR